MPEKKTEAAFIEPILLLRTERLPEARTGCMSSLDGYRALANQDRAAKSASALGTTATSTARYPAIVGALQSMPDETVLDGEVVALDQNGKPSFNLLQNYGFAS